MNKNHKPRSLRISIVLLVLSATVAAAVKLLWQFNPTLLNLAVLTPPDELQCAEIVTPNAALSRERLLKLMTITQGANKTKVRGVLKAPYYTLKPIAVRSGAAAAREVYPLESDPKIWAILLYEDDVYMGVRLVPKTPQCSSSSL